MSFLDYAEDIMKSENIDSAASERRNKRQPRNTTSSNNIFSPENSTFDSVFDRSTQKKEVDGDKESKYNPTTDAKSHRNFDVSAHSTEAVSISKPILFDTSDPGILSQASNRRASRRNENTPTAVAASSPTANKSKPDDFSDFDLGEMLGLGENQSSKKSNVVNPETIVGKSSIDSELPSFLRDNTFGSAPDSKNRGRGRLGVSSPKANVDIFSGVSEKSKNSILKNSFEGNHQNAQDQQLSKSSDKKPQVSEMPKLSILDILDQKIAVPVPDRQSMAKAQKIDKKENDEDSESLSSIALLSDTDEDEFVDTASKNETKSTLSKNNKNQEKVSSIQIANLKEQIQRTEEELAAVKNELANTKEAQKEDRKEFETNTEEKLLNEKSEKESLQAENLKYKMEIERLQKKMENDRIDNELKLAHEMQQHVQKMSDAMTNAEGVSKLNGLVKQVKDNTEKMEKIQLKVLEDTEESLKTKEAAVAMKEVHLARIEEELQTTSRQMQQERSNLENLLLDVHNDKKLAELKRHQLEEKIEKEATRLKNELALAEKTKDTLVFTSNQEKESFRLSSEAWNIERMRLLEQVNSDKKEISMLKPLLEAQKNSARILEQEWQEKNASERNQIEAERIILEADQKELAYRQRLLHREEAYLKTERLKLNEKEREIQSMTEVYQKESTDLEQKYLRISKMRDEASSEKNEAQKIKELVEALQKDLEVQQAQCKIEMNRLSTTKKNYIDQRISKSYLLQEAMLFQIPAASPLQNIQPQNQYVSIEATNQPSQSNNAPHPVSFPNHFQYHSPEQPQRYKRSEAERDLAAALELQLGSYLSKLNQGYSRRKLQYQKVVINKTKS